MTKSLRASTCSYCGEPAEGNHTIHRDGFDIGPEVPLCNRCGTMTYPTLSQIWQRISRQKAGAR